MNAEVEPNTGLPNIDEIRLEAQTKPEDLEAQYRYAWALLNLGRNEEARAVFESGRSRWPDAIEFLYGLGMVGKAAGDKQLASTNFSLAAGKEASDVRGTMLKRLAEIQQIIVS